MNPSRAGAADRPLQDGQRRQRHRHPARPERTHLSRYDLRRWLDQAGIKDGALFRQVDRWGKPSRKPPNAGSVRLVLGLRARKAGLVGMELEPISPHVLRAGFITTDYSNGVADERIMERTRQKNLETMRGYVHRTRLNRDSPAGNVTL